MVRDIGIRYVEEKIAGEITNSNDWSIDGVFELR